MTRAPKTNQRRQSSRPHLSKRELEALIEGAIVDAYGDAEQRVGFLNMFEEHLAVHSSPRSLASPFASTVSISMTLTKSSPSVVADGSGNQFPSLTFRCLHGPLTAGSGLRPTATGLAAVDNHALLVGLARARARSFPNGVRRTLTGETLRFSFHDSVHEGEL
jgi:hypothetical protein